VYRPLFTLFALYLLGFSHSLYAKVEGLYDKHCATCHGKELQGGMASSLVDGKWAHGGSVEDISKNIAEGIEAKGMPAWKESLSAEDIRGLVIYIQEQEAEAKPVKEVDRSGVIATDKHNFTLKKVAESDGILWSIDSLPDGSLISAQKNGKLWLFKNGKTTEIKKLPKIWHGGQGGLLEAAVHPDHKKNGWIYLAYSHSHDQSRGMTRIVRGKIKNDTWTNEENIFLSENPFHIATKYHFGSRIVFNEGYLYFSIGDRGRQNDAQDIKKPNGKVHRIFDDGRIPKDNPFIKDGYPTIYSYGNRNPQGLDVHPVTKALWESEHGPRGGDEINIIEKGKNYGWPEITYGMNYNGTPMTAKTKQEGMEQPKLYWTPSIAVSGIDFYQGKLFVNWENSLLVASLKSEELHRLEIKDNKVVKDEIVFSGLGRIRDVHVSADGNIFVSLNTKWPSKGEIYQLLPAK